MKLHLFMAIIFVLSGCRLKVDRPGPVKPKPNTTSSSAVNWPNLRLLSSVPSSNKETLPDNGPQIFGNRMLVRTGAQLIAGDTNGTQDIYVMDLDSGSYQLVSASSTGAPANDESYDEKFSTDGKKVIFVSDATNLVSGDNNGFRDIFIKDLQTGAIELVSVASDGTTQGNGGIHKRPSLSPDGTKVAFASQATNLDPSATIGNINIYVKDLTSGQLILVTPNSDESSYRPEFNHDGTMLMFESSATNLVVPDTNGGSDILVRETPFDGSAAIYRITENELHQQLDQSVNQAVFLRNSNKVVLSTEATNLFPGDTNNLSDVFVKNITTGVVERISQREDTGELFGGYSGLAEVSADGRYIYFYSAAPDLDVFGADTNGMIDLFVKDLVTGDISRVNANDEYSINYRDSSGTKVLYSRWEIDPNDSNNGYEVLKVFDITTGGRQLVSTSASGTIANNYSSEAAIFSPDASKVYFFSDATNLLTPAYESRGYYAKTLSSGAIERIQFPIYGTIQAGDAASDGKEGISSAAGKVAFTSEASNLASDDGNGNRDIFIHDIEKNELTLVSRSSTGEIGNASSSQPSLSSDGKKLAFSSSANNLVTDDTNNVDDIFLKDLVTGQVTRLSQTASGGQGDDNSIEPLFSPDGEKVYFVSDADNLVPGVGNQKNIYVKNLATGAIELVSEGAEGMSLSADGSKLVFQSWRTDTGVNPGHISAYVKDLVTGIESRISEDQAGIGVELDSLFPSISPDGNRVTFTHLDLAAVQGSGDFSSVKIYIKDLRTGVLFRGDLKPDGVSTYDGVSSLSKFTPDGESIVFYSFATNLVSGASSGVQLYKRNIASGEITKLSVNADGDEADAGVDYPDFHITYDGKAVVFTSESENLVEDDQSGVFQLYVRKITSSAE